jgi:hypothetical protein
LWNGAAAQPGHAASRARYYAAKEARLEAVERHRSEVAARAARQDTMRRYYAHKEQSLDAIGSGEAAARSSNDQALEEYWTGETSRHRITNLRDDTQTMPPDGGRGERH